MSSSIVTISADPATWTHAISALNKYITQSQTALVTDATGVLQVTEALGDMLIWANDMAREAAPV